MVFIRSRLNCPAAKKSECRTKTSSQSIRKLLWLLTKKESHTPSVHCMSFPLMKLRGIIRPVLSSPANYYLGIKVNLCGTKADGKKW